MEIRDFEVEMTLSVTKLKALCDKYELLGNISVAEYRDYMSHLDDSCADIDDDYVCDIAKYIAKNSLIAAKCPAAWVLEHILNKCIRYSVV